MQPFGEWDSLGGTTMSDAIEKTAAGATRTFFGALGFILIMVGVEGMTGQAPLTLFSAGISVLLGALCFYLAFFWERAKKHLSTETQQSIANFAQSRIVKFGMLFLVLATLVLSPFIEQRRWPFSYPADPSVIQQNNTLQSENSRLGSELSSARIDALKWRFSHNLRYGAKAQNGALLDCKFSLELSDGRDAMNLWVLVQPMLELAHWLNLGGDQAREVQLPKGFTILVGADSGDSFSCATVFARELGAIVQSQPINLRTNQVTPALLACKNECVELQIGD
jgi:hypothetical protein